MQEYNPRAARELVEEVFSAYDKLNLRFIDSKYWSTLKLTYIRTIDDVLRIYHNSCSGKTSRLPGEYKILEIGAFSGIVSTALRRFGFQVSAQDVPLFMTNEILLEHYRQEKIQPIAFDLKDVPLPILDNSFDCVICCEVLEHLNFNVLPVLRDFWRILREQGTLYLATPNQANIVKRIYLLGGRSVHDPIERLEWQLDPNSTFSIGLHWREYTAAELGFLLRISGFKESQHSYCHYNNRETSSWLRRLLVSTMYGVFPSFLPGQIIVGQKVAK